VISAAPATVSKPLPILVKGNVNMPLDGLAMSSFGKAMLPRFVSPDTGRKGFLLTLRGGRSHSEYSFEKFLYCSGAVCVRYF
jgi:hypothetical protein